MIDLTQYAGGLYTDGRVSLRPLKAGEAEQLAGWWNVPEWMILQQDSCIPRPSDMSVDLFKNWSSNEVDGSIGFSIADSTDQLVGHITLWGISSSARSATLSIIIGPDYVDMKFGSAAILLMLNLAFMERGLNKVELKVWEFNPRGIHTYEKLGFVHEGRRRAAIFHGGRFWDQLFMSMLATEFSEAAALHP